MSIAEEMGILVGTAKEQVSFSMKIDKAGKVSGIKKQEMETLKTILIGILKIFAVFLIGVKKSEKCKS